MNGAALMRLRAEQILRDHAEGLHEDQCGPDGCEHESCEDSYWLLALERPAVSELADLIGPR